MQNYHVECGSRSGCIMAKSPQNAALLLLVRWQWQREMLAWALIVSWAESELYFWTPCLLNILNKKQNGHSKTRTCCGQEIPESMADDLQSPMDLCLA